MTKLKIASAYPVGVGDALAPYAQALMSAARAGKDRRIMLVGELAPAERTEPAVGQDKEPVLKLELASAEVPTPDQEPLMRDVQRALYLQRTAAGTLDEEGQVVLDKQTLDAAGGHVSHVAAARLRAGVDVWAKQARAAVHGNLSASEMWHEMERISEGLYALLEVAPEVDGGSVA